MRELSTDRHGQAALADRPPPFPSPRHPIRARTDGAATTEHRRGRSPHDHRPAPPPLPPYNAGRLG